MNHGTGVDEMANCLKSFFTPILLITKRQNRLIKDSTNSKRV